MIKKIIFIHGLNNHSEAMKELAHEFSEIKASYLTLPQHEQPLNSLDTDLAIKEFVNKFNELYEHNETAILAYSLGCTYLQYCIENHLIKVNIKNILYLSPALKTKLNLSLLNFLPNRFPIPSLAPKNIRLRHYCYWGQYRTLHDLSKSLKLLDYPLIISDPMDEVINLKGLSYFQCQRNYIPKGRHHIMIDKKYFSENDWTEMIKEMRARLL